MKLNEFLVKAKKQGYATGEAVKLENGGKVLSYQEGDYGYKDTYFGSNPFIGEEVVWYKGKFIWGMNYYGSVNENITLTKEIYEFLKKAMCLIKEDRPFRGPSEYEEENWKYKDESKGNVESFKGKEKIYYKEELVYELEYHGGIIKKNL